MQYPPGHVPVIPPLPSALRDRLVTVLGDLRRLHVDLDAAYRAGMPAQPDIDRTRSSIDRLQRLYDAYFSRPPS